MTTATPPQPAESPPQPPPDRPGALVVYGTIAVALAIVAVIVVLLAGVGRDSFTKGSVSELTSAMRAKGLVICSTIAPAGNGKGGSLTTQVLHVSTPGDCGDAIDVTVDTYKNAALRDAAARNAEMQERQRNYGVVYTWRQFTVYLQADDASTSTPLRDRVVAALDAVGAN
ncbi:MAG TPA: hypothetical protein VHZ96_18335 [Frankiaceae bacterium]|jgi:hypothetical protein|nr:hypothetical protein [Frankiaceae bacterium]